MNQMDGLFTRTIQDQKKLPELLLFEAPDNSDLIRFEAKDELLRQCILQGERWLPAH